MGFLTKFRGETEDGRNFVVIEPLIYLAKSGETFTVPVGATTDGASTPPELWPLIPPFGRYFRAAVIHDAAYRGSLVCGARERLLSKAESDSLLREAMESLGVDLIHRETIYEGVHVGGWKAFNEDRKERA